jgi:hypothetical protein
MKLSLSTRNSLTDAQTSIVNSGFLKIYNVANVVLCSIPLKAQAFNASVDGTANINVLGGLSAIPVSNGVASYFVVCDSYDAPRWSDLCGTDDDGKSLQLTSLDVYVGIPVTIQSGTLTTPEGERI